MYLVELTSAMKIGKVCSFWKKQEKRRRHNDIPAYVKRRLSTRNGQLYHGENKHDSNSG